jgi:hypothetical protein
MQYFRWLTIRSCPSLLILGVLWLLLALFLGGSYFIFQEQFTILPGSQTVPGTIIKNDEVTRRDNDTEYFLVYEYDSGYGDPPDMRTGRQKVPLTLFQRYPQGSMVTVYFQPNDRDTSIILPVEEMHSTFGLVVSCAVPFVIITLTLLFGMIRRFRGRDGDKRKNEV